MFTKTQENKTAFPNETPIKGSSFFTWIPGRRLQLPSEIKYFSTLLDTNPRWNGGARPHPGYSAQRSHHDLIFSHFILTCVLVIASFGVTQDNVLAGHALRQPDDCLLQRPLGREQLLARFKDRVTSGHIQRGLLGLD